MVRLYTIENCPYCAELKKIFQNENVEFTEVDVNKPENQDEFDKLYEITKCDDVPMVKVGKQILIPETSFTTIREAADLTKKFLI